MKRIQVGYIAMREMAFPDEEKAKLSEVLEVTDEIYRILTKDETSESEMWAWIALDNCIEQIARMKGYRVESTEWVDEAK